MGQQVRKARADEGINWINAPAVPVAVLHLLQAGKHVAGHIISGPMGQITYRGPVRAADVDDNWRDGLKMLHAEA
jgi:hypothetical protein